MQSHGYATGRNLAIVRRSADLETHRLRAFAAEMAAARLDVIVATTIEAAKAAKVAAPRRCRPCSSPPGTRCTRGSSRASGGPAG